MTKAYLDSAYPPNDAQLEAAKAAGYSGWNGYFAGPNILNGWLKADFDRVKRHGLATMAYCSGWSSALAMRAQSAAWGVKICLDVEGGIRALIRPDDHEYLKAATPRPVAKPAGSREAQLFGASSWVQPWLSSSGGGVYGNYWVHPGLSAAFYVLAAYPTSGDPANVSWSTAYGPRPGALCAWQWAGSHNFAGRTVDSCWFDDALHVYLLGSQPKPPVPPQTGDDDMLYTSIKLHPLTATLKVDHAAAPSATLAAYRDPSTLALTTGPLTDGASVGVAGYVYSSSYIDADVGGGKIASDHVWWLAGSGQWVPDAVLYTFGLTGAPSPAVPAGEPLDLYLARRSELGGQSGGGVTIEQVRAEVAKIRVPTTGRITGGDVVLS